MKKQTLTTRELTYIALMAVLMAVCAWIAIPSAVPFTMQTFGVFVALSLLGGRRGTWSVGVYLLLGAVGLPVFAGFKGGLGALLGSTGGYIIGFFAAGLVYWLVTTILGTKVWVEAVAMVLGLMVCYAFGTAWFMVVYAQSAPAISVATALSWCVIPYIIPDLGKIALALVLSRRLGKQFKRIA